jgi:hypothetical protein
LNLSNVNVTSQLELPLDCSDTNVLSFAATGRFQSVALGPASITATYGGISNSATVSVAVPQDVQLVHRYSFSEASSAYVAHDSAGSAHGRLFHPGVAFNGKGELTFSGAYVDLPDGIISSLSEISVEAWVTWTSSSSWQRIFDFGDRTPVLGGWGRSYFFLTPYASTFSPGPVLRATITTNSLETETPRLDWTNTLPLNVTSHVAVAYSPVRGVARLYLNGALIDSDTAIIPLAWINDTNNWLGRSQFQQDPYFSGRFSEFRIYGGLLSDSDIAADYAAGPDIVGSDFLLHTFVSSNNLTITWGQSASSWLLESTPALGAAASWNEVTNSQTFQNGRYSVTVPMSGDAEFFRLRKPN